MNIHTVLLWPGDKMNVYCTDGMLPDSVKKIKEIFNFGDQMTSSKSNIQF